MKISAFLSAAFFCAAIFPASGMAGAQEEQRPPKVAVRRSTDPIKIDGVLDRKEWKDAVQIDDFHLFSSQRSEVREPFQKTTAWLAYDDDRLCIAFRCAVRSSRDIKADVRRRDGPVFGDESVEVFLNPDPNHSNYYQFGVNPLGCVSDARVGGNAGAVDASWTSMEWKAAARVNERDWTCEMAFPFRILEIRSSDWRINLTRNAIRPYGEALTWAPIKSTTGWQRPEQFGYLRGMEIPKYIRVAFKGLKMEPLVAGMNRFKFMFKNNCRDAEEIGVRLALEDSQGGKRVEQAAGVIHVGAMEEVAVPARIQREGILICRFEIFRVGNGEVFHASAPVSRDVRFLDVRMPNLLCEKERGVAQLTANLSPETKEKAELKISAFRDGQPKAVVNAARKINGTGVWRLPDLKHGRYRLVFELMNGPDERMSICEKELWVVPRF
ncbi:MAG: sugar-binding protein [Verrucomicrobiae bacterium]|nr:sugar-binding protein [Verrucomicrobiae bacterium]